MSRAKPLIVLGPGGGGQAWGNRKSFGFEEDMWHQGNYGETMENPIFFLECEASLHFFNVPFFEEVYVPIENGHLWWIFPLKMVIFHCYVSSPEGRLFFETWRLWLPKKDERRPWLLQPTAKQWKPRRRQHRMLCGGSAWGAGCRNWYITWIYIYIIYI